MNSIFIGFSRPKSKLALLAHIIRFFEGRTPYSHVFIRWNSDKLGRNLIYEAKSSGINFTSPIYFSENVIVVKEFELIISSETKTKILQFCIDNARKKYGVLQIFGIGIVRLIRKLGFKIENPFTTGMVCSELVGKILNEFLGFKIEELDLAGPRDIYEVLEGLTNGKVEIYKR